MRYLWLTDAQARAIIQHARDDIPHETCGILGGQGGQVSRIIPTPNSAPNPQVHYQIGNAALVTALMALERDGLELVGFYHSHPTGEPLPSPTDVRLATYPDCAYLIVGFGRATPQMAAWRMRYGQVDALPLHVGPEAPTIPTTNRLSRAQTTAILVSALLALVFILTLSVYLLPPAPEIPIR